MYEYSGDTLTKLVYSSDGKLNQKYRSTLDKNGNEIMWTIYDAFKDPEKERSSYEYRYDSFDKNGNWTQRTRLEVITESGKKTLKPSSISYRTITYYE